MNRGGGRRSLIRVCILGVMRPEAFVITARRERLGLFGLTERIIYLGFLAWFVLLGVLALS